MSPDPSLQGYLKALWRGRWIVVGTVFGLVALTAVVSLLIPKTFEATALLQVVESKFKPELAAKTPAVQTCQMWLGSPKIIREVQRWLVEGLAFVDRQTSGNPLDDAYITGIVSRGAAPIQIETGMDEAVARWIDSLDADALRGLRAFKRKELAAMTIEDLGESLSSQVTEEKKTAIDIIYSPVIRIKARGRTGEQAALLANTWAAVFFKIYGDYVRAIHEGNLASIADETSRSKAQREVLQRNISRIYEQYNQAFWTDWLEKATKDFGALQLELARRQLDFDAETSKAAALATLLAAVEDDGVWVGATTATAPLEKPGVAGTDLEMRRGIISGAARLKRAESDFEKFMAANDLDTFRKKHERAQIDLVNFESKLKEDNLAAEESSRTLATVDARLTSTPRTLQVQRPTSGGSVAEIINPEWDNLQLERTKLEIAHARASASQARLRNDIPQLADATRETQVRISRLEPEHERLRANLDLAREEYLAYQQGYVRMKSEIFDASRTLGPLRARVEQLRAAVGKMRSQIDDAQSSVTRGRSMLAGLESEDETLKEYVSRKVGELREAEMAVAQQGLDVKLTSEAIPPTKKIWPQRTLMVMAMAFVSLFFSVGLVLSRHYLLASGLWPTDGQTEPPAPPRAPRAQRAAAPAKRDSN